MEDISRIGFIYCIENKVNQKKYIGQTIRSIASRFKDHVVRMKRKENKVLYDAMNKYGLDNFIIYEIERINKLENLKLLSEREVYWIQHYNTTDRNFGYNMTQGGDICDKLQFWSESERKELYKTQQKSREATFLKRYGVKHLSKCPEITKNWGQWKKGKSLEALFGDEKAKQIKENISKTLKEKGHRPPVHHNGNGGHKHTNESKQKMSIARKGKTYEEIFGKEVGKKQREVHSESNSLRYLKQAIDEFELKLSILLFIQEHYKCKYKDILDFFNIKKSKLRKYMKEVGFENYQKYKYNYIGDKNDWIILFDDKIKLLRSIYEQQCSTYCGSF